MRAARVVLATNAFQPLVRSIGRYVIPVYDYVLVTEPLDEERRAAIGWRGPRGPRRLGQPLPLLPAHRRRPHPLGRLRGDLPLGERHAPGARGERGGLQPACPQLLRDLPAARGPALHAPLGGRDRHQLALLRDLRDGARRPGRLCGRLHGPGGGRDAASAPRWRSTSCTAATRSSRGSSWCAAGRSRSRPSRFAPRSSQATRRALIRADERRGRRGPWLRLLDRMGAGFDS